jgi:hypothetical protein
VLCLVINAFSLSDLKLFKVDNPVPYEFNVSNTFKPDIYNDPFIFVVLSKLVNPLTFNDDTNVVLLFNVVKPLTFNAENNEVLLFKVANPLMFNEDNIIVSFKISLLLTNNSLQFEKPLTFKFENIVVLSDVILFASISFKPVEDKPLEDKPQQFI